jgi:hypothetical protein
MLVDTMAISLFAPCPHCGLPVEIIESNCCIFRHGVYKDTLRQIDPHMPKEQCDALYESGKIYGCGQPFRLVKGELEICGYL